MVPRFAMAHLLTSSEPFRLPRPRLYASRRGSATTSATASFCTPDTSSGSWPRATWHRRPFGKSS